MGTELRVQDAQAAVSAHPNAVLRWASLIVRTVDCADDPRTLSLWGRSVGASVATLRSRCAAVETSTKVSLDFARLLRALVRSSSSGSAPGVELDVYDPRTLRRLLERGGIGGTSPNGAPPSLHQFLSQQRFVRNELALQCVAKALLDRKATRGPNYIGT